MAHRVSGQRESGWLSPTAALNEHHYRFSSAFPTIRAPYSRSSCTNSERYAASRKYYQNHVHFRSRFLDVRTKGPSMDQGCAFDVYGCAPGEKRERRRRCALDATFSCSQIFTNPVDLPSGCCNVETLGTSKHRPPSGRDYGTPRTRLGLDARRGPSGVYRRAPRCV